jgi:phage anti-repressor protein
MTIDDFEWVEDGFDRYILVHKQVQMDIAIITNFNGWNIHVWKETRKGSPIAEATLDLDAAKAIAMLYANQHIEEYRRVFHEFSKRKRASEYRPEAVPKGVFRVDKLRS